ncbi:MAG: hypothetical protein ACOX02_05740 [Acholeplasmatales bacterium]
MKKILSFALLLIGLLLVACDKGPKTNAEITIKTITPARDSVYISLDVVDVDKEITEGSITALIKEEKVEVQRKVAEAIIDENNKTIIGYKVEITGLKVGYEYSLEIFATIDKKLHTFVKETFKTTTAGSSSLDPKYISTVEEFLLMETDNKAFYKLSNDLDFTGVDYRTIFVISRFEGTLDGAGYTLKNITINERSTYTAIFGRVSGTITNLKIDNMNLTLAGINKHSQYIGLLVGRHQGTINDVEVTNSQISTEFNYTGKIYVGGLIGYGDTDSIVNNANVNVTIDVKSTTQSEYFVGGLAGYIISSKLENSNVNVILNLEHAYKSIVGGVVGFSTSSGNKHSKILTTKTNFNLNLSTAVTYIRTNHETSKPEIIEVIVGGFVGKTMETETKESIAISNININRARVLAIGGSNDLLVISGFIGALYNASSLDNTYYETTITTNILEEDLKNLFDQVYITGSVGISSGGTFNKASGKLNVDVVNFAPIMQITPLNGVVIVNPETPLVSNGDYFNSTIKVENVTYTNEALLVVELDPDLKTYEVKETILTPKEMADYYTSTFVKENLNQ